MIKYHNAFDGKGKVVSIKEAEKGKNYLCLSCGREIFPKLGNIREHHFCHKKQQIDLLEPICSEETYLHKNAKYYIKELFDKSSVFNITYRQYTVCNQRQSCVFFEKVKKWDKDSQDGTLCENYTLKSFNLKEYYDTCEIEKEYHGYRADVLLTSRMHPSRIPLFIEIVVTNTCSQKKLESGIKIIEILVPKKTDILTDLRIEEGTHSLYPTNEVYEIKFHNFKRKIASEEPLNLFDFNVYYRDIYNKDTSRRENNKCEFFGRKAVLPNTVCEVHFPIEYEKGNRYSYVIKDDLTKVRTCWLCNHHSYNKNEEEHNCDTGRTVEKPTRAYNCAQFVLDMEKANEIKEKTVIMFQRSFNL